MSDRERRIRTAIRYLYIRIRGSRRRCTVLGVLSSIAVIFMISILLIPASTAYSFSAGETAGMVSYEGEYHVSVSDGGDEFTLYNILSSGNTSDLAGRSFMIAARDGNRWYAMQAEDYTSGSSRGRKRIPVTIADDRFVSTSEPSAIWTFEDAGDGYYYVSTTIGPGGGYESGGTKKYLNIEYSSSGGVSLIETDSPQRMQTDTDDSYPGRVRISTPDTTTDSRHWMAVTLFNGGFTPNNSGQINTHRDYDYFALYEVEGAEESWPDAGSYIIIVVQDATGRFYAVKKDGSITPVTYYPETGTVTFRTSDVTDSSALADYEWQYSEQAGRESAYVLKSLRNGLRDDPDAAYIDPSSSTGLRTGVSSAGNIPTLIHTEDGYLLSADTGDMFSIGGGRITVSGGDSDAAKVYFANKISGIEVHGGTGSGAIEDPDLTLEEMPDNAVSKELTDNGDGTYTISLSITGKTVTSTMSSRADVIIVFDTSGSMLADTMNPDNPWARMGDRNYEFRRDYIAKTAINRLAENLLANNTEENPDAVKLSLISFNSTAQTEITGTSSLEDFNSALGDLYGVDRAGTNWEAALKLARSIETRPEAVTHIVFVSDGDPSNYSSDNAPYGDAVQSGGVYLNGDDSIPSNVRKAYDQAKDDARNIVTSSDNFYTLAIYGDVSRMEALTAYAYSGNDMSPAPEGYYFEASDETGFNNAFARILDSIGRRLGYGNVTITDGITDLTTVAGVEGDVDSETFTYKVTRNGEDITSQIGTLPVAVYENGNVTWSLGTDYQLEDEAVYTVSFTVWPSQDAYDLVADLNNGKTEWNKLTEEQKSSVRRGSDGTYTLKTNNDDPGPSVTYEIITKDNGEVVSRSEEHTISMDNPDPVTLAGTDIEISKEWDDSLDGSQLLDMLAENPDYKVVLDLYRDGKIYSKGIEITPTIVRSITGKVTDVTWSSVNLSISPGVMISEDAAAERGITDASGYETVTYNGSMYYVLETGHDYYFDETEGTDYHFELDSGIYHPMVVDGMLMDVTFSGSLGDADSGEVTISAMDAMTGKLHAVNKLKGGIQVYKKVYDSEGEDITDRSISDRFIITVKMKNPDGTDYEITAAEGGYRINYGPNNPNKGSAYTQDGEIINYGRESSRHDITGGTFTVELYAGDYVQVANVDEGVTYEVTETLADDSGYTLDEIEYSVIDKTMTSNTSHKVYVKNMADDPPPAELPSTGGSGTAMFYVLGTLLAAVSIAVLIARRRRGTQE